jgi:arabinofuranan 3-O-arabinosyltransferase
VRWAALPLAAGLGFWAAGGLGLAVALGASVLFATAVRASAQGRGPALARALASPWPVAALMFAGTAAWAVSAATRSTGNPAAPTDPLGDLVPQLLGLVIVGRLVIALWPNGTEAPADQEAAAGGEEFAADAGAPPRARESR